MWKFDRFLNQFSFVLLRGSWGSLEKYEGSIFILTSVSFLDNVGFL